MRDRHRTPVPYGVSCLDTFHRGTKVSSMLCTVYGKDISSPPSPEVTGPSKFVPVASHLVVRYGFHRGAEDGQHMLVAVQGMSTPVCQVHAIYENEIPRSMYGGEPIMMEQYSGALSPQNGPA